MENVFSSGNLQPNASQPSQMCSEESLFRDAILKHPKHRIQAMAEAVGVTNLEATKEIMAHAISDKISMHGVDLSTFDVDELSLAHLVCACVHFRLPAAGDRTALAFELRRHLSGPSLDTSNPFAVTQGLLQYGLNIQGSDKQRVDNWNLFQLGLHRCNYEDMEESTLRRFANLYLLPTGGTCKDIQRRFFFGRGGCEWATWEQPNSTNEWPGAGGWLARHGTSIRWARLIARVPGVRARGV